VAVIILKKIYKKHVIICFRPFHAAVLSAALILLLPSISCFHL